MGSPELANQPQSERLEAAAEQRSIAELVSKVEARLEQNPEDGRGWDVLGPVYMRLGRYDDAVGRARTRFGFSVRPPSARPTSAKR